MDAERRSPSAKPEEQSVVRSCKTVLKSSESIWLVMWECLLVVFVAPQQETTLTSPRRTSRNRFRWSVRISAVVASRGSVAGAKLRTWRATSRPWLNIQLTKDPSQNFGVGPFAKAPSGGFCARLRSAAPRRGSQFVKTQITEQTLHRQLEFVSR